MEQEGNMNAITGPFDAAISLLRELEKDDLKVLMPSDHPKILLSISVLEAAKKIDEDDYFWAGRGSVSRNTIDLLATILDSCDLPDEEV
jgi:hypothetical protein